MSDYSEILEVEEPKNEKTPEIVRVLSILSYIGNGFWILTFFIIFLVMAVRPSAFNEILDQIYEGLLFTIFSIVLLINVVLGGLCIYGAHKMYKGFKSGFVFYAFGNGLWILLLLFGNVNISQTSNYVVMLISLGFIISFGTQLKNLK